MDKRLSHVPPDDFTRARDELARELKAKGHGDEAKAIARLRKPPAALFIVNQLGRLAPADVKALIDATARMQKGAHLREAMHEQREALSRLGDAAGRAALEAGTKLTLSLQRRVLTTVQSAASSEPDALREGTLDHELQATGFEGFAGVPLPPPPSEKPAPKPDHAREKELQAAEQAAKTLSAHAVKLERAAAALEEKASAARKTADEARSEADQAAARALELRRGQ